jgi:hypothetical protein
LPTNCKTAGIVSITAPQNGNILLSVNAMAMTNGGYTIAVQCLGTTNDAYPNLSKTIAGTANLDDTTATY